MSSTYSPSLRIELIGAGEQAGTWNTTTNTNLGTLIESAIAGYIAVSITSANQALTAVDGAADQSRNAIIALTTTTTAAFNVYAPPQEKQYVIWNNSAYTATIYNSTVLGGVIAAGLGVSIPAGKRTVIFSTGVNFYDAVNYAAGAFSVGGALTVTGAETITGAQVVGGSSTIGAGHTVLASQAIGGSQLVRGSSGVTGTISTTSSAYLNGAATPVVAQSTAINTTTEAITLATAAFSNDLAVLLTSSGTMPTGLAANTNYYVVETSATSYFSGTASISGTTLDVTSIHAGSIGVGTVITGNSISTATVTSLISGTGGIGTYGVSVSQTAASNTIIGTYSGAQTIKLSTTVGGSAANITAVGTGNLTLTPISLGVTAPVGASTNALATCGFVAAASVAGASQITNAGGWNVTPSGTTLFFNYNGTNVAKLDSSGNLTTLANITAYGTV